MKDKILYLDELVKKVRALKKRKQKIVQSHGVFDIIHPGIIQHLNLAKKQGDVLIVTVVKDKDVRRGPGRPIFNENLRLENVASLKQVDYVALVDDGVPFKCVKSIEPDVFAKGLAYKDRDQIIHGKIFEEDKKLKFGRAKIYHTNGFSFDSKQVIDKFLDIYPEETKKFLKDFSKKFSFQNIAGKLNKLNKLNVLLIGDGIIDEYHYCESMGKASKAHLVVNKYLAHEVFAGGAFAIANHLASLCGNVHLVSLLGDADSREDFVLDNLKPNISSKFFHRNDGPTVIKKRYLNQYLNQKLFEVNYLDDKYISGNIEKKIVSYLRSEVPKYDLVLISDFGHGFITKNIIDVITKHSKKFAVNTQTNAANAGYNLITKYSKPYFICVDEGEMRLAAQKKHDDIDEIAVRIKEAIKAQYLIVTLGKQGSIAIGKKDEIEKTPIFSTRVVDTIGAGDAFFAFTAPCLAANMPLDLVSFVGNVVGALAVQIVGNKKPVEKYELLEFINNLMQ
jgi:rfaE bifunctional protein kinase chain/domain